MKKNTHKNEIHMTSPNERNMQNGYSLKDKKIEPPEPENPESL